MDTTDLARAVDFVHREGRVLERRVAAALFDRQGAAAVATALRSYQNPDGGFGWGLEPDKRVPHSQPLDVEIAWQTLDWVGAAPADLVEPACDHLASIGPGVSCVTQAVVEHPHAPHWGDASDAPSLNPTASLAGYLWKWGVDHAWRAAATEFCWSALGADPEMDAHTAIGVLRFLAHVPDRDRAEAAIAALRRQLPTMPWLQHDPASGGYGVSPLQLLPTADNPWPDLFPPDVIEGHLDALETSQAEDGGWTIRWPTLGVAAEREWRGRLTLQHLVVLRGYGRLSGAR